DFFQRNVIAFLHLFSYPGKNRCHRFPRGIKNRKPWSFIRVFYPPINHGLGYLHHHGCFSASSLTGYEQMFGKLFIRDFYLPFFWVSAVSCCLFLLFSSCFFLFFFLCVVVCSVSSCLSFFISWGWAPRFCLWRWDIYSGFFSPPGGGCTT